VQRVGDVTVAEPGGEQVEHFALAIGEQALDRLAVRAARRVESLEALEFVSKVFWFSLEFGVVHEDGGPKAYGAGLLSSYGEIEEFGRSELRPLDLARMGVQTYDITHYQPVLFAAESWQQVHDVVGGFFDGASDDLVARLVHDSRVDA